MLAPDVPIVKIKTLFRLGILEQITATPMIESVFHSAFHMKATISICI